MGLGLAVGGWRLGVGGWALGAGVWGLGQGLEVGRWGLGVGGLGRGCGYIDGWSEDKGCCSTSWRGLGFGFGFGFGLACTTLQSLPHEKSAHPCAKPCSPVQREQWG